MNAKLVRPLLLTGVLALGHPAASFASYLDDVNVQFAPPALPYDTQPPCPDVGYLWTPGYWAYSQDQAQYYWVAGQWVMAPQADFLWTPGYWSQDNGYGYIWNAGYWGPHVGFYGGVNYGFGYFGVGFQGGYWRDHAFFYNRAVTNINNWHIRNVYNETVVNNRVYHSRVSFNGPLGIHVRPTSAEAAAAHEPRRGMTDVQRRDIAVGNPRAHTFANPPTRARFAEAPMPTHLVTYSVGSVKRAPQHEFKAAPIAHVAPRSQALVNRPNPHVEMARHVNLPPPVHEPRKA